MINKKILIIMIMLGVMMTGSTIGVNPKSDSYVFDKDFELYTDKVNYVCFPDDLISGKISHCEPVLINVTNLNNEKHTLNITSLFPIDVQVLNIYERDEQNSSLWNEILFEDYSDGVKTKKKVKDYKIKKDEIAEFKLSFLPLELGGKFDIHLETSLGYVILDPYYNQSDGFDTVEAGTEIGGIIYHKGNYYTAGRGNNITNYSSDGIYQNSISPGCAEVVTITGLTGNDSRAGIIYKNAGGGSMFGADMDWNGGNCVRVEITATTGTTAEGLTMNGSNWFVLSGVDSNIISFVDNWASSPYSSGRVCRATADAGHVSDCKGITMDENSEFWFTCADKDFVCHLDAMMVNQTDGFNTSSWSIGDGSAMTNSTALGNLWIGDSTDSFNYHLFTSPPNTNPIINSNNTYPIIPSIGSSFLVTANISEPDGDDVTVNFTIGAPNGSLLEINTNGTVTYENATTTIWNSTTMTIWNLSSEIGTWNWSYNITDGEEMLFSNGSFEIKNEIPVINSNVTIPNTPSLGKSFFVNVNLSDKEGHPIPYVNFTFETPNGSQLEINTNGTMSIGNSTTTIWNSTTITIWNESSDIGTWKWNYTTSDGVNETFVLSNGSFEIANSVPSYTVLMKPDFPDTNDVINCSGTFTDSDGHKMEINFSYYVDGIINQSTSYSSVETGTPLSYLFSTVRDYGQIVNCTVNASDSIGDTYSSSSLTMTENVTDIGTITILPSEAFGSNITINVNVSSGINTNISDVNFSLWNPKGTLILNNLSNISVNGRLYNSTYSILNETGIWRARVNAKNNLNVTDTRAYTFNVGAESFNWEPLGSGDEVIYLVSNESTQDHSWITYLWQPLESQNYSIIVTIDDENAFLPSVNISNPLIPSSTLANPYSVNISLDAQATISNGTYTGTINFTRQVPGTINVSYVQEFVVGVNPPSGILILSDEDGIECAGTNCDQWINVTAGSTKQLGYIVNNTGSYKLDGCEVRLTGDFDGVNWWSYNLNNSFIVDKQSFKEFVITINTETNMLGEYEGLIDVLCLEADSFGHNTTAQSQPRITLSVEGLSGGGGGSVNGGGAVEERPPLVAVEQACTENAQCGTGICDTSEGSINFGKCVTTLVGNGVCEPGESIVTSPKDCSFGGRTPGEIFAMPFVRLGLLGILMIGLLVFLLPPKKEKKKKGRKKK